MRVRVAGLEAVREDECECGLANAAHALEAGVPVRGGDGGAGGVGGGELLFELAQVFIAPGERGRRRRELVEWMRLSFGCLMNVKLVGDDVVAPGLRAIRGDSPRNCGGIGG